MALHRLVLLALLSGSACVDVEEPPDPDPQPSDQAQVVSAAQLAMGPGDVCDLLPEDGACRYACDHAALVGYVPEGTCAVFRCDLLDGREISVHACRPDE